MAGPGLLGRTFMDDEGAVGGGLLGLGPMSGSQKAAMLFAGLQDAFAGFQGRGPTNNLDQLAQQYGQQNYRQQVRKDRLDDKDAARKAEQDRREWELKNRQPDLKTAINPETNQMGQYYLDPTSRQPVWVQGVKLPGEAPKTRTKRVGMQDVMEEYDPISMKWNEVSRGAAFKPDAPRKGPDAPSGYRWNAKGGLEFIPGGPQDPKVKGVGAPPNVDQAKNRQLYGLVVAQLPVAESHYDDLGSWKNQLPRAAAGVYSGVTFGQLGDPSNTVTGEKGRLAENAIKDIATSYTYSVSGATAPPKEVQDKTDLVMPKFTDSAKVRAQKKARLRDWAKSIQERGGYSSADPAPRMPPPPGQQQSRQPAQPQARPQIDPAAARAELARRAAARQGAN